MWSPKPKGKVIRRPKPSINKKCRAGTAECTAVGQQEKSDPHRDVRYFGVKHSDITRIFFVDSTNSLNRGCPAGPFEKKQTDITSYLERAIPSHAAQLASSPGQQTRVQGKRNEPGDIRASCPGRLPSACANYPICTARRLRRDHASAAAGIHEIENVRPTTAPTGEMRRLSAANSGSVAHTPVPSIRSGTACSKRTYHKPCSMQTSRPGTMDSGLGSVPCSAKGSALGPLQCSSRLLTGNSCAFGSRLQSVPE